LTTNPSAAVAPELLTTCIVDDVVPAVPPENKIPLCFGSFEEPSEN
jgi:hypothetical protein